MRVRVAYFSGTGGTALVARELGRQLRKDGIDVWMDRIGRPNGAPGEQAAGQEFDMLVLAFCVHDFNAPHPVATWLSTLPKAGNLPAAVISVSGGGEMCPNRACRKRTIEGLERLGYDVFHEDMMVMPSAVFVAHRDPMAPMLLQAHTVAVRQLAARLAAKEPRRTRPPLIDRAVAWLFRNTSAKYGPSFAHSYAVSGACDACGRCAKGCPAANITLEDQRPVFGDQCVMCMSCVYGCPEAAITLTKWKFYRVKPDHSLARYRRQPVPPDAWTHLGQTAKGLLWLGTRRYLETLAPEVRETHRSTPGGD